MIKGTYHCTRFSVDGAVVAGTRSDHMEFDYTFDGDEPLDPGWEIVFDSGEDPPRIVMEVYRGGDRQEFIIRHRKA